MKLKLVGVAVLMAVCLTGCSQTRQEAPGPNDKNPKQEMAYQSHYQKKNILHSDLERKISTNRAYTKPWKYQNGKRVFKMSKLDHLGRSQVSHIQVKKSQLPTGKRPEYITAQPSGWHNYKFWLRDGNKHRCTWLYNRGHLVGYQFCGVNNDRRNLVTETTYLNQGSLFGMDEQNSNAMLFYENGLRHWINRHPTWSLDYSVRPVYYKKDLVPESVVLTFTGYKPNGKQVNVLIKNGKQNKHGKISWVTLINASPQAEIDYRTGRAAVYDGNGRKVSNW